MSSTGQILGGVVGAVVGFVGSGFNVVGAFKGAAYGMSLGGMIDPPPGPDLKGPTLEDAGFNSSAYGVSLATLHGTIAHTGSIIYLENNEYKAVAKKEKTGGKGGGSKGSYTTTTYFATFAVAVGEAMPGSVIRRIWAGGKLIYSVGDGVDIDSIRQSTANAGGWHYYSGTQTEPDSRMEAVLGVGNCPSYEGTAYIIFYDFDLTEYGNGLQGCPIKVEVIADFETENDDLPFQKVYENIGSYPAYVYHPTYGWLQNPLYVRALTLGSALFVEYGLAKNDSVATYRQFSTAFGWEASFGNPFDGYINTAPGLSFSRDLNWVEFMPLAGPPGISPGWSVSGWASDGSQKMMFGDKLQVGTFIWDDEPVYGAAYGNGFIYIINNSHIIMLLSDSVDSVYLSRATDFSTGGTYYRLWFDSGFLYRLDLGGGTSLRLITYDGGTLETLDVRNFGDVPADGPAQLQFAVYGDTVVIGWATRYGTSVVGGDLHYEQWRIKNFNVLQKTALDKVVGRYMSAAGIALGMRDLSALETDYVDGYKITDAGSARAKINPLQIAYLFDLIEDGYTIKAVKRGGNSIAAIPLSKCGARSAGEAPSVLIRRDRETSSQLPSRYSITHIDYNREYDTNTQYADYPAQGTERNQQLPVVLSATAAAQLADIYINLAWVERFAYEFNLPQDYVFLKPTNIITQEISAGVWAVLRITNITYSADQRLQISARRAEPALYQSGAAGVTVTPPSENIPLISDAKTVLMDLPAVRDSVSNYGFGVAMTGGNNWRGGNLLRSVDNGQIYDAVQAFSGNCTIARALNYLVDGDYFVIDRAAELDIDIISGDFFSITEEQMLTGKNYCAYGADGRWEIIQFANATVASANSIKINTFVRGLFGTEWAGALHQSGDMLVLLDDPDNAFIGADAAALNSPRKYKAVTVGQDFQAATEIDFTYRGVNLKPLSPVNVSGILDNEEWTISWSARTRMASGQWATGISAPMGEAALLFEIEFYDGAEFKKMYSSNAETFEYSAAAQMADFGRLPVTFSVKIYQISAVVGRGYAVQRTLIGAGDIYVDSVLLLLHADGANGSTTIVDSSNSALTVTAVGGAVISTAQAHSGGSSFYLPGGGSCLSVANSAALGLGLGDFTLEAHINASALPASGSNITLFDMRTSMSGEPASFYIKNTGGITSLGFYAGAFNYMEGTPAVSMSSLSWYHCAWVRSGGILSMYVQGVKITSFNGTSNAAVNFGASRPLKIGVAQDGSSGSFTGYIDEIRITPHARYDNDFTPPTQKFPDP